MSQAAVMDYSPEVAAAHNAEHVKPRCPTCGETRPQHWAWCTDPLNKPRTDQPREKHL